MTKTNRLGGKALEPPPRPFSNMTEKPPASASVFAHAAWFLADYAELWWDMGPVDDPDPHFNVETRCKEMTELTRRLRELDGEWEAKRAAGSTASAAEIIADMLQDWKLPGAVWWAPDRRRWRVTGKDYRAGPKEICVGVYAPGATAAMLQEDFEAVDRG
jgi:hypothetical protein